MAEGADLKRAIVNEMLLLGIRKAHAYELLNKFYAEEDS
jgi:hypothetical protein